MANQSAKNSTKNLVDISDIRDNVILLKDGSLRAILEVPAINFELRSGEEQTAILQNFQRFLNSTDFPLQIVINSRQLDMTEYIKLIDVIAESSQNELIKIQASEYSKFVKELLELSNIMSKKFYISIPFYVYETPTTTGLFKSLKSIIKPSSVVQKITDEQIETYKVQLLQRAELIFDGLIGMGLKGRILEREELVSLFYNLYNPSGKSEKIQNPES